LIWDGSKNKLRKKSDAGHIFTTLGGEKVPLLYLYNKGQASL
jgi:hypothetical protein